MLRDATSKTNTGNYASSPATEERTSSANSSNRCVRTTESTRSLGGEKSCRSLCCMGFAPLCRLSATGSAAIHFSAATNSLSLLRAERRARCWVLRAAAPEPLVPAPAAASCAASAACAARKVLYGNGIVGQRYQTTATMTLRGNGSTLPFKTPYNLAQLNRFRKLIPTAVRRGIPCRRQDCGDFLVQRGRQ
jgi:hypothetical protein